MKSFIELVEKKIKNNIKVDKIEIIDNTYKHLKHKSYNKDKLHLKITIQILADIHTVGHDYDVCYLHDLT